MGSVLLGAVARRRQSDKRQPVNHLSDCLELGESVFDSKELNSSSLPQALKQSVNIGKIARTSERGVKDVEQVIAEVSERENFNFLSISNFN